jgi:PBSX family phage terminase large subunit
MLYGGSRSGKTFIIVYAMIVRACKTKSRHISLRHKFNHAKTSIWMDTLPKVLSLCFPNLRVKFHKTDYYISFPNGSEYWIAGLDDSARVEKILGKEYSTIHFNEASQIPYPSVGVAMTRLAEKNSLKKKAYFDENPPSKRHWSYSVFIQQKDPNDWSALDAKAFDCMIMNPGDNLANIDENYITDILDNLPSNQKARFKDGKFDDADSPSIYHGFLRENNVKSVTLNPRHPIYIGMDFNVNPMTAVVCHVTSTDVLVAEEIYLKNSNTHEMAKYIVEKYGTGHRIIPDATGKALKTSAAGFSDHEILRQHGFKIESSINPFRMDRYNAMNKLLEDRRLWIDPRCVKLIKDLEQVIFKEGTNMPDTKDKTLGN